MRKSQLDRGLIAGFCLALLGCSDPGGGGGVLIDGTNTGTDATGEVSFADTPVGEGVGGCTNGERRCSGQIAQQCVSGAFQDLFECPSTQICEAGACRAAEVSDTTTTNPPETEVIEPPDPCEGRECGPDGQGGLCGTCILPEACNPQGQCVTGCTPQCGGKQCGSDGCGGSCGTCGQFQQCVQGLCEQTQVCDCAGAVCGVDNCGNSCGTCPANASCSGGVCVTNNNGGGDCVDLIDCIFDDVAGCYAETDQAAFDLCVESCYAASSQVGADEFDAYIGCLQACPPPDDDPNTTADDLAYDRCVYQNCSDDEASCALDGFGSLTCFEIIDCYVMCADGDDDCVFGCYEQGTAAAQAALWGINNCLTVECPDINDEACIDAALQDQCVDFLIACQSN